jgi:DHA1 family multidrug resistance protein-like MFS transporter
MASAFQDTLFAYILRSAFGSRVFPHEDEKSLPTIWQEKLSTQTSPRDSTVTTLNDAPRPDAASACSGPTECADAPKKADAEKGNDTLLVEWYGPTDPDVSCHCVMARSPACLRVSRLLQNPQNWSSGKKAWVMFQTCLLTFTIYVGSAIYTAGIPSITADFHVSTVAATLGLTLFVAGYGLG